MYHEYYNNRNLKKYNLDNLYKNYLPIYVMTNKEDLILKIIYEKKY